MYKKIISIMLVVLLFVCPLNTLATEDNRHFGSENDALELMMLLDIIDAGNPQEPDKYITRGEAAHFLAKVVAVDTPEIDVRFDDVTANHPYIADINLLAGIGAISKGSTFRPEDAITFNEFIKMAVSVLGYDYPAQKLGGYPEGYLNMAAQLRLLKGVYFDENGVMLSTAAVILENVINSECNQYNDQYPLANPGTSLLEYKFSVYKASGVLSDNGITDFAGESKVNDNEIIVDSVTYRTAKNYEHLLGYYVDVYYKYDSDLNRNEVLLVKPDVSENTVTTINYDDIVSYSNNTYVYCDEDGDEEKFEINYDTVIIYNGKAVTAEQIIGEKFSMIPKYGEVVCVSNDGNTEPEVVFINNYSHILVKSYMAETKSIYGYYNAKPIPLDKVEITVILQDGTVGELSDISGDKTALMVATSLDGKYIKFLQGGNAIKGTVDEMQVDDGEYCRIGDGLFAVVPGFTGNLKVGISGEFYIDAKGGIFAFEASDVTEHNFAYVVSVGEERGLRDGVLVQLYTQYDTVMTLKVADRIKIDGQSYKKNNDFVYNTLVSCIDDVVLYSSNLNGEITYLDTTLDGDKSGITIVPGMDNESVLYIMDSKSFDGRAFATDNTVVFVVPEDFDTEYMRACTVSQYHTIDTRGEAKRPGLSVYTYGDDTVKAAAVLARLNVTGQRMRSNEFYFVEKIIETTNKDGEPCHKLSVRYQGKSQTYFTADADTLKVTLNGEPYTIGKGDCIVFGWDKNGNISKGVDPNTKNINVVYSASKKFYNTKEIADYSTSYSVYRNNKHGWIYDDTDLDGYYKVCFDDPSEVTDPVMLYAYNFSTFTSMFVYDTKSGKITTITADDLITYKDDMNNCSEFVFYKNSTSPGGTCIVYK